MKNQASSLRKFFFANHLFERVYVSFFSEFSTTMIKKESTRKKQLQSLETRNEVSIDFPHRTK